MNSKIKVTKLDQSKGLYDCPGYLFSATASDIRDNQSGQLDLALIVGEANQALKAGAVFTQNDVTAAPVDLCKTVLEKSSENIGGIVVNSGNANACTGEAGITDAREMSTSAQVSTDIGHPFFVCSTGRIGRKMPINKIIEGIASCSKQLDSSQENSEAVSKAILTSDTFEKSATVNIDYKGQVLTLSGIAKGAGMIEPNMATMLAFLVTDLDVSHTCLQNGLKKACDKTFNCISIDGDMSTNDSVILLANGHSKLNPESDPDLLEAFEEAIFEVCDDLARKIVSDGEKITKVVTLDIQGCSSIENAEKVARAIGNSLLVKSAFYGSDPNWGRVVDAAGYARIGLDINKLDLHYDSIPALISGNALEQNCADWKTVVEKDNYTITLNLNQGTAAFQLITTDLSEAYVNFNKSE